MSSPETDVLDSRQAGDLVIRGSAVRLGGYALNVVASIVSSAVLLRHLGVDDAGRYATVLSLSAIVAGVTDAGMVNIGVREYAQRAGPERERILRGLLGLRVALSLAGTVLATAFALAAGYTAAMTVGTVIACLAVVVFAIQSTYAVPLGASLRLGWLTLLDTLRSVGVAVGITVLSLAGAGLVALLACPLPIALVTLMVTLPLVVGTVPLRPSLHRETWGELLKITLPYAAATAVGVIYAYLSVVVLQLVASPRETGLFGASFRVFVVLQLIPALFVQSAFPVMARAARDDAQRFGYTVRRVLEVSTIAGGLVAVATAFGARFALDVVAGADFADAVPALRVQGIALAMTFLAAPGGFALLSLHRHRALLVVNAIAFAASLVLTVVLGGAFGAHGAAYANLVGELVLAVGYGVALALSGTVPRPEWRIVGAVVVAVGLAVAAALLSGLGSLPAAVLASAVYLGTLAVLRAYPPELALAFATRREGRR
jgi:O-antigen/teichoic acid export membrane protein